MKVILFGATGMVGQGVLRECLRDDGVEAVLAVGRSSTGQTHPKLRELITRTCSTSGRPARTCKATKPASSVSAFRRPA